MQSTSILLLLTSLFATDLPKPDDNSIKVELFAENPQLVTPTGIAVDQKGRVFVAESNTHFRPQNYKGPARDRILILEDTDGDGRADKSTVFHEGYTHIMDIAFNDEGWLYVATRMDIHRMRDTKGDGKADDIQDVVIMKTTGTYPHNGLSGLCFNSDGTMNFGLGENLGHDYTLVGSDGTRIGGGGEGGSTYHVNPDGTKLRRVTTGWWNPFGMCVDQYGRIFGTDNDPGASPPCRLIQIHEGADYGYEYRYGRTGLHPLITWTGEMVGTIPMIGGTGEAPCGIMPAHLSKLPAEYRNDLLVASWADHQIERYAITQPKDSGQVKAERHTLVLGGNDFRPVGLATAPDGSIYVSDWVSASYQLHGLGRVWKISGIETDNVWKRQHIDDEKTSELKRLAKSENSKLELRVQAVQELIKRGKADKSLAGNEYPVAIRALVIGQQKQLDPKTIVAALESSDPVLQHAAIQAIANTENSNTQLSIAPDTIERFKAQMLLALKRSKNRETVGKSIAFERILAEPDAHLDAWKVVVKWIADDKLLRFRDLLKLNLESSSLTPEKYLMIAAAIDRLDGKKPRDIPAAKELAAIALDSTKKTGLRATTLRLLGTNSAAINAPQLIELAEVKEPSIRLEAIRLLGGQTDSESVEKLLAVSLNAKAFVSERLAAIAGLANVSESHTNTLIELAKNDSPLIASGALQSLSGIKLNEAQAKTITAVGMGSAQLSEAADRVLEKKPARASNKETAAWMKLLNVDGDATAGERVFFHSKIGTCSKCHQHGGRGTAVGPSLSLIAKRLPKDKTKAKQILLETILQPSKDMAPQYTPWIIVTTDGRQLTGLPRRKGGNSEAYLGVNGKEFSVKKSEIDMHKESRTSIMPEGLLNNLTTQELRDLFAFLLSSK